ncbi:MAG: 50S ribosomal protein L15e [Candidatus Nanoarchaeia archaeon]
MSIGKYLEQEYRNPSDEFKAIWRERMIAWRKEPAITRIEKPTRVDRARALGYKAKQGYVVVRVKVKRGGRTREQFKGGRRPKAYRRRKIVGKNYRWVAEERASRKYKNCEVLGSYQIAKDGKHYWFEIILADRQLVSKYKGMEWLAKSRGRAFRGITSAGRKSRGLRHKGKGAEKIRPSLAAHGKRGKN